MRRKKSRRSTPVERPIPRVAVLVDTSTTWGRQVITGIQNYALKHGPWQTFIEPRGIDDRLSLPRGWSGQGVIARVGRSEIARAIKALNVPVVNVSGIQLKGTDFPRVVNDLTLVGKLAARYFLERGHLNFAYYSLIGLPYVYTQQTAFINALKEEARPCSVFSVRPQHGSEPNWNLNITKLTAWLKDLPKPVAVLTWNANCGRQILYACHSVGLMVPEDVAILSASDDRLLCEFSHIPISGIQIAAVQIGHSAAALLDNLMHGHQALAQETLIPPIGVITRQSTDTLAIHDAALLKALGFIRTRASQPIKVDDVAVYAGVSRRLLEMKFQKVLGRSPASEIRRAHFERARELLIGTDLPIPEVAASSGFCSPEYMSGVFKARFKQTPLRYRKNMRGR